MRQLMFELANGDLVATLAEAKASGKKYVMRFAPEKHGDGTCKLTPYGERVVKIWKGEC